MISDAEIKRCSTVNNWDCNLTFERLTEIIERLRAAETALKEYDKAMGEELWLNSDGTLVMTDVGTFELVRNVARKHFEAVRGG